MMIDEPKKPETLENLEEPDYEDDKLGATMMDMDLGKLNKNPKNPAKKEEKEESVDDLLKKQKSLIGRIGNIFGKK